MQYKVCQDCAIALANDDYSGLDSDVARQVRNGVERLGMVAFVGMDEDNGKYFYDCDCCGSRTYDYAGIWEEL